MTWVLLVWLANAGVVEIDRPGVCETTCRVAGEELLVEGAIAYRCVERADA